MDQRRVAAWRMHNLRLTGPALEAPEDVVRWLGAVQSQDYGPAKWSVGQRMIHTSDAGLDRAVDEGALLRTHALRPTWHFVAREDIRWIVGLTAPRVEVANRYMYNQLDLDEVVRGRATDVLVAALEGGRHLTRAEAAAALDAAGIQADGLRLGYILMHAELTQTICSGPRKGRQHTYALLDERAHDARRLDEDEALAELTRRFFTSHGPASAKDFQSWSSLTLKQIRHGLALVGDDLERTEIGGVPQWHGADLPPDGAPESPTVHLLQGYDEYVMGYRETRDVIDVAGASQRLPDGASVPVGILVLDTQLAGHWQRTITRDAVHIDAGLYRPFDADERHALQAAADRHASFLDLAGAEVATSSLPLTT